MRRHCAGDGPRTHARGSRRSGSRCGDRSTGDGKGASYRVRVQTQIPNFGGGGGGGGGGERRFAARGGFGGQAQLVRVDLAG